MYGNRAEYSAENCSLGRALEIFGERWTMLVLREALLGTRRFDDFQQLLGCARNVLAARLAKLVERGILARVPYREAGQRERFEYKLTEKGRDLAAPVIALTQWGDRWESDPTGAPAVFRHHKCGLEAQAVVVCAKHGSLAPHDLAVEPGPGAKRIA
jgi:DNA-binding HxlR family transcriptional regulator